MNEILKQFEACILVDGPAIPIHSSSSAKLDSSLQTMGETITTPDSNYKAAMYVPEEG
jgi:translation initiation factor 2 gamma subunit (eIF-2gamma)